jgi:DHA2 family multidrug resistance protein
MALKQLMLIVRRQAVVMAFADVFLILSVLFVAIAALAVVMKRPAATPGGAGAH